ncbi:TELO2-interacting protein 2 [Sorex araneus]|uniref:TELO2-interacting protein 2 n=1 Tax=Sorex araneus TaxID=42254 RepID=UPI002433F12D|nr:TELO2-interacting protein 2 [Sorex araneus]
MPSIFHVTSGLMGNGFSIMNLDPKAAHDHCLQLCTSSTSRSYSSLPASIKENRVNIERVIALYANISPRLHLLEVLRSGFTPRRREKTGRGRRAAAEAGGVLCGRDGGRREPCWRAVPSAAVGLRGGMEPGGAAEPPAGLGRVLRQLAGPGGRAAALRELDELLDGAGGGPEGLGRLAGALARAGAPPAGPARAEDVAALLGRLLARAGDAGAARVAGPAYVFAVGQAEWPGGDPRARAAARELLAGLVAAAGAASVPGLLRGAEGAGLLPAVLELLRPELSKESWKKNPATKHVFSWTLQQVTRPWLSDHLENVLPPSLLISDDYQTENKILGVQCLHHILLNVPAADLLQYNRAQVVYHALFNHLYTPEHQLIEAVLPCLLDLFPVLERGQHWKGGPARPTTHCDEVLQLVLTHMEPEHRLVLRRTYARSLPAFVKRLGTLTVRHLKRLERVVIGYLEVYDGPEEEARLKILETLKLLMQYTWPRMPCRTVVLLKALLKLICDVARDPDLTPAPVKQALLEAATDCLIVLDHCSKGQVKGLLAKIAQSCDDDKVVSCIRKVQVSGGTPNSAT